ncbi:MAG: xanthine dehydrogenase [Rhodobacterales bacterium]|nr:MAG: xanthine dehydrogenase [Rhodobacterales bacterium]
MQKMVPSNSVQQAAGFAQGLSHIDPIRAVLRSDTDCALAIICGVEGPSYRDLGAMMFVDKNGKCIGSISSGCVEADIVQQAFGAIENGNPRVIRYGIGSPFMDIRLPCGGGLDLAIVPNPEKSVLRDVVTRLVQRQPVELILEPQSGALRLARRQGGIYPSEVSIYLKPELNFLIFGSGPEAISFAGLVASLGYHGEVCSPDGATLEDAHRLGCAGRELVRAKNLDFEADSRTAIVLFFHDHDWEPPILKHALTTDAFYIGAQGSLRASATRNQSLRVLGVSEQDIERITGPIGIVKSARDPRTLAISVLAEVVDWARMTCDKPESGNRA